MNLDFPYVEGGGEEERRGKGRKKRKNSGIGDMPAAWVCIKGD